MGYDLTHTHTHTHTHTVAYLCCMKPPHTQCPFILAFEDNVDRRVGGRPGHITFTGSVDSGEATLNSPQPLNHMKVSHQTEEKNFEGRSEGEAPCWRLTPPPPRLSALLAPPLRNWATAPRHRPGEKHWKKRARGFAFHYRNPQLHRGTCTFTRSELPAAEYSRNSPGGVGGPLFQFRSEIKQIWFCALYRLYLDQRRFVL